MAKTSGLGDNIYIEGYDLSGDIGTVKTISSKIAILDITSLDKFAIERIPALRDGLIEYDSFFNNAAGQEHVLLSLLPRTDTHVSYFRGTTRGNPTASIQGKQTQYNATRGADGSLIISSNSMGNAYGLEWGISLTAGKESVTAINQSLIPRGLAGLGGNPLPSLDNGSSTSTGASSFLHVMSIAGGSSINVAIQDSPDNITFTNIPGLLFSGAVSGTALRATTSAGVTVNRYVRAFISGVLTSSFIAVTLIRGI